MKPETSSTGGYTQEMLRVLASPWLPADHRSPLHVFRDTTAFFKIEFGDIVLLADRPFLVRHNAREGRFGVDDEIKFWVKRAIDLHSGELKVLKLVFHEEFMACVGGVAFRCYRSPKKEARVLALVARHPNFMHGRAVLDPQGNLVRVIDFIYGKTLAAYIEDLNMPHADYFSTVFPQVLERFVACIEAIRFLHEHGEKHGDIRRDHIIIDRERDGAYRWIDFDYTYEHRENRFGYDLFGLGNVLIYLVGKGDLLLPDLRRERHPALDGLNDDDLNVVFHHRVANLKKIFPYIPDALNRVLLHFSKGAKRFYEHTTQLLEDLEACRTDPPPPASDEKRKEGLCPSTKPATAVS